MSRASLTKTAFTAGELDPLLFGRLDLRAQEDGAARLRNVVAHPTGGVSRRPGLRLALPLPGALRLIAFDGSDGGELLALGEGRIDVVKGDAIVASIEGTPWGAAHLARLGHARWGNRLFVCHPDLPPCEIVRDAPDAWRLSGWEYEKDVESTGHPRDRRPYVKFAAPEVAIELNDRTGQPIPAGSATRIRTAVPVLTDEHIGVEIRVKGKRIRIVNVDPGDPQAATGLVLDELPNGKATLDWDEQAFSVARGWPATVAVHQERLVIGGSRSLPDRLWFSRTGHPLDFDPAQGEADAAFSFRLTGDEHHAIASLMPGRQLQVFTRSGEWVIPGALTPGSVQAQLQTRIGSFAERRIQPVDVDGATLFVGGSGRELREFLYADSEQAYQAADIALLSRHLLEAPMEMSFDRHRRWLLIVRADGRLATVVIDRNNNVVAWSLLRSTGAFRGVAPYRGEPHFLVELDGNVLLERFEAGLGLDHAVTLRADEAATSWSGLSHLEGREAVALPAGGAPTPVAIADGAIELPEPASEVTVGAPFTHTIEPLPLMVPGNTGVALDRPYRPVRVTFRLHDTAALRADTGSGPRPVPLPAPAGAGGFSGDVAVRAIGWRRGAGEPPWRVAQDDPAPCTILSVTTEIMGDA